MNDNDITNTWTTLEPTVSQRRRISVYLFNHLEAHDTTIAAEWFALIRVSPVSSVGLAAVSTIALLVATPLVWFAGSIAGALM